MNDYSLDIAIWSSRNLWNENEEIFRSFPDLPSSSYATPHKSFQLFCDFFSLTAHPTWADYLTCPTFLMERS